MAIKIEKMDSVAVVKHLREVQAVLADLSYSEGYVETAVSRLGEILGHCAQYDVEGRNATFDLGIIKALLGILRSSSNPSLIGKVANCLALLVHCNEEGREQLGNVKHFFQLLVDLLSPKNGVPESERDIELSPRPSWDLSQAEVYEQVLNVLRKLTYLNSDNQVRLAQSGGIKLIVNLLMSDVFLRNSGNFGLESKRCLESLTVGKKLACRATFVPKSSCGTVLSSFQALSGDYSIVTAQYPAFYVSLATEERKWISSSMIEMGVVWPDHTPFPLEGSKWTKVIVSSVENGNNVWCQFWREKPDTKVEEIQKSLDEMPPPLCGLTQDFPLSPGDVYAVYCDPEQLDSPSSLSEEQWCRARLLSVLPGSSADSNKQVVVLAVDYGFMMTIPESHLAPLPPQCRGFPPQAIPCRLVGVAPLPPRQSILESTAAILRNLTFDSFTCRSEIAAMNGVEALLELCQCPNEAVTRQSMCALLNMSVAEKIRPEFGQRGAIDVLLKICQRSAISKDLLDQTLHCLLNMLQQCSQNVELFLKAEGDKVLRNILISYKDNEVITKSVAAVMNQLPSVPVCDKTNASTQKSHQSTLETASRLSPGENTSSKHFSAGFKKTVENTARLSEVPRTSDRMDGLLARKTVFPPYRRVNGLQLSFPQRSITAGQQTASSPPEHTVHPTTTKPLFSPPKRHSPCRKLSPQERKEKRQLYEARRKANGERVRPNPIYRLRGDQSHSEEEILEAERDDEILIKDGEREMKCEASGSVTKSKCYLVNCALSGGTECETRCFVAVENVTKVSRTLIKRTVCAMMNLGKTSTIFIGVLKDGTVKGVKLSKVQRDRVCVAIDGLMEDLTPILTPDLYTIHFVPVAVQLSGRQRLAIADGYFIIELTLLESPCRQIYTLTECTGIGESYKRCYYRMSVSNVQLSFQELRDIIAWEVAASYSNEVRNLEKRLNNIKKAMSSDK